MQKLSKSATLSQMKNTFDRLEKRGYFAVLYNRLDIAEQITIAQRRVVLKMGELGKLEMEEELCGICGLKTVQLWDFLCHDCRNEIEG